MHVSKHGTREKYDKNRVARYTISKGKLEPRHSRREIDN